MSRCVTIEVTSHLRAKITGLRRSEAKYLDEELSHAIEGSEHAESVQGGAWDGRKHYFYKRTGGFPTGLLRRVRRLLKDAAIPFEVDDRRKPAPRPNMKLLKPDMLHGVRMDGEYSYQLRSVRKSAKRRRGVLRNCTNAGKTEQGVALIKLYLKRCKSILWLTHKQNLQRDTITTIATRLGTIEENIGRVGGGVFAPKKITVAMVQSLRKTGNAAKDAAIARLLRNADMLICDEVHHAISPMHAVPIRACPAGIRYGLSGSFDPDGPVAMATEALIGPVCSTITNAMLVKLGVSAKPLVELVDMDEPADLTGSWPVVYRNGIVDNIARNKAIIDEVKRCIANKEPIGVLVREKRHGGNLSEMLREARIPHKFLYSTGFPGGLTAIRNFLGLFEKGFLPCFIATTGLLDEGANVPALRCLVIADGFKSLRLVLQRVGRALRRKKDGSNTVRIVDFADSTNEYLARHSMERYRIYEEEGFDITER